jgi:hypothetical protein
MKENLFTQIEFCENCAQKCYTAIRKAGVCCIHCKLNCIGKIACPILDNSQNSGKTSNLSAMQQVRKRNKDARAKRIGIASIFPEFDL